MAAVIVCPFLMFSNQENTRQLAHWTRRLNKNLWFVRLDQYSLTHAESLASVRKRGGRNERRDGFPAKWSPDFFILMMPI